MGARVRPRREDHRRDEATRLSSGGETQKNVDASARAADGLPRVPPAPDGRRAVGGGVHAGAVARPGRRAADLDGAHRPPLPWRRPRPPRADGRRPRPQEQRAPRPPRHEPPRFLLYGRLYGRRQRRGGRRRRQGHPAFGVVVRGAGGGAAGRSGDAGGGHVLLWGDAPVAARAHLVPGRRTRGGGSPPAGAPPRRRVFPKAARRVFDGGVPGGASVGDGRDAAPLLPELVHGPVHRGR
mmetsp:Transcript_3770/g.12300  ORF Transcript_3770/g.12300 Transcript_3770/m.12300 type:complete len:239 (+) Transcript_3770:2075-2791(+)